MSNRFKKSIENLEKTEFPNNTNESASTESNKNSDILIDILANIPAKEAQGKSVALYLSVETNEAVTKLAQQKGISKSKLVDNILKQILLS